MPGLKKKWGQHHLAEGAVCRPLLAFLRPAGERVVEIGPGGGVLTRQLLEAGAERVVGWEIDPEWAATVGRELGGGEPAGEAGETGGRLSVVVGDALEIDWPAVARGAPGGRVLAAGNLPYNVATPIIERLLPHHRVVPRAGFLVQKEVGERLVAGPGDPDYGYLSVLVGAWAEARLLGVVRRGAFRPPPKVDGAFVGLVLHPPPLPEDEMAAFLRVVSAAFALRRKTLRNSLASALGKEVASRVVDRLRDEEGWDPRVRAESLGLEELLRLYRAVPS